MTPGKIVIKDKVYFEYYLLEKPNKKIYDKAKVYNFENLIIQKYEASKQLIEVKNVMYINYTKTWIYSNLYGRGKVKNNTPCKAEVTNNKATIVELIK